MQILHLLAQAAPDTQTWPGYVGSFVGGGAISTGLMWRVHAEDRKDKQQLMARLFLLADRSSAVASTAAAVAKDDPGKAELQEALERLTALLQERDA